MWWECERALRRSKIDNYCSTITCQKLFNPKKVEYISLDHFINKGEMLKPAMHEMFKKAALYGRHRN
jgi:hypothetical protein